MGACRHCATNPISRPLRLCGHCYIDPEVRELYRQQRRVKPASYATDALPGSLKKILVLMHRAAAREELWHPDDAPSTGRSSLGRAG